MMISFSFQLFLPIFFFFITTSLSQHANNQVSNITCISLSRVDFYFYHHFFHFLTDYLNCEIQFCEAGIEYGESTCGTSSSNKLLIKGGTVVNAHHQHVADVYVEDGIIVAVQPNILVLCFNLFIFILFLWVNSHSIYQTDEKKYTSNLGIVWLSYLSLSIYGNNLKHVHKLFSPSNSRIFYEYNLWLTSIWNNLTLFYLFLEVVYI